MIIELKFMSRFYAFVLKEHERHIKLQVFSILSIFQER